MKFYNQFPFRRIHNHLKIVSITNYQNQRSQVQDFKSHASSEIATNLDIMIVKVSYIIISICEILIAQTTPNKAYQNFKKRQGHVW